MARNKNFLDWTDFTTPASGRDLQNNSLRKTLKYDIYQDKTKFKAIALTDMHPVSQQAADIITNRRYNFDRLTTSEVASMKNVRWIFRARILGNDSPHNFIPDPCDTTYIKEGDDLLKAMSYIQMHTQFITPTDYDFKKGKALVIKGDVVWVELDKNVVGYNLQMGRFVSKIKAEHVGSSSTGGTPDIPFHCDNLRDIFQERDATRVPIGASGPIESVETSLLADPAARWAHEEGKGSLAELLSFIAAGEGNYNSINAGGSGDRPGGSTQWPQPGPVFGPLTNMTIGTLQTHQAKAVSDSTRIFAAGRYQVIPTTLTAILPRTGLTSTDLYSQTNQDKIGHELIKSIRDTRLYLQRSSSDIRAAALGLAKMWASLPDPSTGRSFHGSVGGNASSHTVDQVYRVLVRSRGHI